MNQTGICCAGSTAAVSFAEEFLRSSGFTIHTDPRPDTGHILLDIPSFRGDVLRDGNSPDALLSAIHPETVIWGGGLDRSCLSGFKTVDLLKDHRYLAENAAITADCAVRIVSPMLQSTWRDTPVLILGWGRIGKCLGSILKSLGCSVTIAARKESDLAILPALGCDAISFSSLSDHLPRFRLVFNTVPEMVLPEKRNTAGPGCILMDLASRDGIEGDRVIRARGLPGIHAPESSGRVIAETMIRLLREDV